MGRERVTQCVRGDSLAQSSAKRCLSHRSLDDLLADVMTALHAASRIPRSSVPPETPIATTTIARHSDTSRPVVGHEYRPEPLRQIPIVENVYPPRAAAVKRRIDANESSLSGPCLSLSQKHATPPAAVRDSGTRSVCHRPPLSAVPVALGTVTERCRPSAIG